jgi:hypothetical protein
MALRDYLSEFPLPVAALPERLRKLLLPATLEPHERIEVCANWVGDLEDPHRESLLMLMAVVPEEQADGLTLLEEGNTGTVEYSVPVLEQKGNAKNLCPSVSGHDYVVAAWGDGSFHSYSLAEKVWMTLGLSPRCLGGDEQRIVYDDRSTPSFGIAEGDLAMHYNFKPSRNVRWEMRNDYLRRYLWMRGAVGVRTFFYECRVPDSGAIRAVMQGASHFSIAPPGGWFQLDLREHEGELLIQVWATVVAVTCEMCPEQSCEVLGWPGLDGPVSRARANALVGGPDIHLDDKFLERYEQNAYYDTAPRLVYGQWACSPSYVGQWSFTDCRRVGRNAIRVPLRELYKPKPDIEIIHAHGFVLTPQQVDGLNLDEEHIVSKTNRLVELLLDLGDGLTKLGKVVGLNVTAEGWSGFSREHVTAEGWASYPPLRRLAQTAPLDMSQQAFLARCKVLHEVLQRIPNGYLKRLLEAAGCPAAEVRDLGSLKLLQALLNVLERLDAHAERVTSFPSKNEPAGWNARNPRAAALFLNNDLRIADAHEAVDKCMKALQEMGFDTVSLDQGYGRALDFVFDHVIDVLRAIDEPLTRLLTR